MILSPESPKKAKAAERESRSAEQEKESLILATGLEDYGRWTEEVKNMSPENDKPYRRGRIWA